MYFRDSQCNGVLCGALKELVVERVKDLEKEAVDVFVRIVREHQNLLTKALTLAPKITRPWRKAIDLKWLKKWLQRQDSNL